MKFSLCITLLFCLSFVAFAQAPTGNLQIRWKAGDPRCDKRVVDGNTVRTIKHGDLLIAAAGTRQDGFYAFEVTVSNNSQQSILVDPAQSVLWLIKEGKPPSLVETKRLDPENLAVKYRTRAMLPNTPRPVGAATATEQTVTNSSTTGTAAVSENRGNQGNVNNSSPVSATSTRPTYVLRSQALRQNAIAAADAKFLGAYVQNSALRANTVSPQQDVRGNIFFENKKAERGVFAFVIEGTQFEFIFGLK